MPTLMDPDVAEAGEAGERDFVQARCFGFGVTRHGIAVTVAWGTFDEHEARALGQVWTTTFTGPPRDTLVDVTGLVMPDAAAFAAVRALLEQHRQDRARVVTRQAVVANDDFGGTFVRGYFATFPPPYPLRIFEERAAALQWLGHPCCLAEITAVEATRDDVLARLRHWLDSAPLAEVTFETVVPALEVTARTLQRRLADAGTHFTAELARAQVARAQRLMMSRERRLSEIAHEVGCATPSTFSELFRRVTGETPSAWRRRHLPRT